MTSPAGHIVRADSTVGRQLLDAVASPRTWCAVAGVAFAASVARVLSADVDRLLRLVPDDTFYYLQIARHIASSGRSTFDGFSATNGYHPLWMAVLSPLAAAIRDPRQLLSAAIVVSCVLHVLTAAVLGRLVAKLADSDWGWAAAACWLVNPLAVLLSIQSTEATLHGVLAVAALTLHVRFSLDRPAQPLPARKLVVYGVALGALCLARTTGAIFSGLALAWLVKRRTPGGLSRGVRDASLAGLALVATFVPWLLYSLREVGTIVQDSGVMKSLWASGRYPTFDARLGHLAKTLIYFGRRTLTLMTEWNFSSALWPVPLVGLALLALAVVLVDRRSAQSAAIRAVALSVIGLATASGLLVVDAQIWWLGIPCLGVMVIGFVGVPRALALVGVPRKGHRVAQVALVIASLAMLARWHVKDRPPYPWQPDVRRSELAFEAHVPPDARIGCFNAGIPAYFGTRRIVALDGLVSHDAVAYWRSHRVDEYLGVADVAFIADEERALQRASEYSTRPLSVEVVATAPLSGWPSGRRVLWRVVGASGSGKTGATR